MAEGKFPKKPRYGNVLEACRKDFRNFKKDNGDSLIELYSYRIQSLEQNGAPNQILINQKENLKNVKRLIHEGKEEIAFSIFIRTFPSCLPYRSRSI